MRQRSLGMALSSADDVGVPFLIATEHRKPSAADLKFLHHLQ